MSLLCKTIILFLFVLVSTRSADRLFWSESGTKLLVWFSFTGKHPIKPKSISQSHVTTLSLLIGQTETPNRK
ncbi:hypothetical protein LDENG_00140480 [Lucifuga dentata]|nr:hypothetical protein LDENG_00140480 [Lucifuga dentata]